MKNITIIILLCKTSTSQNTENLPSIVCVCFNQLDSSFYVSDLENNIYQLSYDSASQDIKIQQVIPADPQLAGTTIINITYLVDTQCLCVVNKQGSIFKVSSKQTELVAQNEDGIYTANWSPSQDRLIVITKNNTIIQLNEEFNLDNELPLNDGVEEGLGQNSVISWKPDGKFCVISLGIKGSTARKCLVRDNLLNVFKSAAKPDIDPKGFVQSVSQTPVIGLQSQVSWNPSGNIIAGVDIFEDKQRVIFFQKNGLRHLQFNIPQWVKEINALNYSNDGQILYVQVLTNSTRQLLVYHRANYHWYLKSTILLTKSDKYIIFKQRRNNLFIIGQNRFQSFQFTIKPNDWQWKSYSQQKQNPSCVYYSVDGSRLLISDYNKSIIPPPMCLKQFKADSRIISTSKLNNHILVITTESIYLYQHTTLSFNIVGSNTIKQRLCNLRLLNTNPITFTTHQNQYTIEQKNLTVKQVTIETPKSTIIINEQQIQVHQINNQLFVNGILLSQETTSYCLYDVFLLFTTNTSELYEKMYVFNLEIQSEIYQQTSPTLLKRLQLNSLNMRNVQRGSKIIGCSQGKCVFQLPRGNLEGINPKIITLLNVKRNIDESNYLKAFELVRTHKLDMNLLFDINPEQFLNNGQSILNSIKKVDYISLLIASLKQGVSGELKYCLNKQDAQKVEDYFQINKNKVNTVCQLISKCLRQIGYEQYILAIVAAEVKRGELPKILHEIKVIKSKDVVVKISPHLTQQPKKKKHLNSKQILEYVCWMADPEIVYKVAFLTFDLELVAMAAEFTQKDPKEYLPYLEELKAIPNQIDRRSRICLDLKHYSEAVKQLALGTQQQKQKAISLIQTHNLFKTGIQSFIQSKDYLLKVKTLLGQYLQNKDQNKQAFNIYITCGLYEKALNLSIKLSDTANIFELAAFLKYSPQKILEFIKQVIVRLVQHPGDGQSLGLAYQHLHQYQQASKIYIKFQNFQRLNKIIKYLPSEYVSTQIIQSHKFIYSLKHNQTLSESKTFTEKYLRLQAVQKMKKLTGTLVVATKQADEMYSQYSRASSQSKSNYTVSTTTGMKKKKQKVKGILSRNVKEGSPLEQQYLIAVLNDLSSKGADRIKSNKVLIQQLIYMNLLLQAESLRDQTRNYAQLITKRVRPYKQTQYEQENPDVVNIYPPYVPIVADSISSFDYIL